MTTPPAHPPDATPITTALFEKLDASVKHTNQDRWEEMTENARMLERENTYHAKMLRHRCEDWAEDDTRIKELAKPFGIDVEGDSYGVPTMVEVVERMAEMLTEARKLCGTLSELHDKGEADNAALRIRVEILRAALASIRELDMPIKTPPRLYEIIDEAFHSTRAGDSLKDKNRR